jgi:hypothetical protein
MLCSYVHYEVSNSRVVDFKLSSEAVTVDEHNVILQYLLGGAEGNSIEIRTGDLNAEQEGCNHNTATRLLRPYQVSF